MNGPSLYQPVDFEQIAAAALPHVASWLPGSKREGKELVALNPRRGDKTPGSFKVNMSTGAWGDFSSGDKGGDAVSLWAFLHCNDDQGQAAKELRAKYLGSAARRAQPTPREEKTKDEWRVVMPVPADAPAPMEQLRRKDKQDQWVTLQLVKRWIYRDAEGEPLGHVCRFHWPDGQKEVVPQTWCTNGAKHEWRWLSFPKPRPLYGLDKLAKARAHGVLQAVLVEGEKTADAAQDFFPNIPVVTWPGGTKAVKHVDLEPLRGFKVVAWPDADLKSYPDNHARAGELLPPHEQPGMAAMLEWDERLRGIAAGVRVVDPVPSKPDGWDLADAHAEGWTSEQVMQWLTSHLLDPDALARGAGDEGDAPAPAAGAPLGSVGADDELWQQIDPSAPLQVAKDYLAMRADSERVADMAYWQGEFWTARPSHYEMLPLDALKSRLYHWLERKVNAADQHQIKPNKRLVDGVLDALKAAAHVDNVREAPAWLSAAAGLPDPGEIIACRNGLLHVPTRELMGPTRRFFTLNALDFDYVAEAPEPVNWLAFLRDLWRDDRESIETLQEIFGLALTSDTKHQKAFLIVGPRRSGKGTIARVLASLVGMGNVTAPMLASFGQQFGLESMIGKTLALVSDARLGGRADQAPIVENLLRISGEDAVSVPRKFKTDWTAKLRVRFVILSNEVPAFLDQSGALAGRFIVLRLTQSYFGHEDLALTQRLLGEMPGVLLWALAGLDRLREREHFIQPASALEMVRQLETLASPIKSFVADSCIVGPGASAECGQLFEAWTAWTRQQGRDHAGSLQVFGRNLAAAFPEITVHQRRVNGARERLYVGIRLRCITDPDADQ